MSAKNAKSDPLEEDDLSHLVLGPINNPLPSFNLSKFTSEAVRKLIKIDLQHTQKFFTDRECIYDEAVRLADTAKSEVVTVDHVTNAYESMQPSKPSRLVENLGAGGYALLGIVFGPLIATSRFISQNPYLLWVGGAIGLLLVAVQFAKRR